MPQTAIKEDVLTRACKSAADAQTVLRDAVKLAQAADENLAECLTSSLVFMSGTPAYSYDPFKVAVDLGVQKPYWTKVLVRVEAVDLKDGHDRMVVVRIDNGSKWIMRVRGTNMELAPPDTPTDGSYMCMTCKPPKLIAPDAVHEHNCPIEGDKCGTRECNITGSCQG